MSANFESEIEELLYMAAGKTEDETETALNEGNAEDFVYEQYDVDFETYSNIVMDLIPFTVGWESPLTNEKYQGFVTGNRAIVKRKMGTTRQ